MPGKDFLVAEGVWSAWARHDIPAVLDLMTDDVCHVLYIPQEVLPFGGGPAVGKPAISDRLQMILAVFEPILYDGKIVAEDGGVVRGSVHYVYRHRVTNETFDGIARHVLHVANGLVTRIEEYHDNERIRAFMALVSEAALRKA